MASETKQNRPRKVFGRRTIKASGAVVTIEMHEAVIIVRPFRSRRAWRLPLDKLAVLVMANGNRQP